MAYTEFKPNSNKFKEEEQQKTKKVEKAITGKAKLKKKSGLTKFRDVFIPSDITDIKGYIFSEVLIPKMKNILSESFNIFLYGESRGAKNSSSKVPYVSYRDYSSSNSVRYSNKPKVTSTYDLDEIILDDRGEAEAVVERMSDLMDTYNNVSVADLYDLVGIEGRYTDNNYGWTSTRGVRVVRVGDGTYSIRLPRPTPID